MELVKLTEEDLKAVYETRMVDDFPPDELRPYSGIISLLQQGQYTCFGCKDKGQLLAYAFFVNCGGNALLDYFAVDKTLRGQGIGSLFFNLFRENAHLFPVPHVLLEVESVESTENLEEQELRRRRIRFYENCGGTMTPVVSHLFGVEYNIMYMPMSQKANPCPDETVLSTQLSGLYDMILSPFGFTPTVRSLVCHVFSRPRRTRPLVVAVAGGTCSGKSTLSDRLGEVFRQKCRTLVIHMDSYFKKDPPTTLAPITRKEYVEHNSPDTLELPRMYADFEAATAENAPWDLVIIEGLFALYLDAVRQRSDIKVFVDLPSDERLVRRIVKHMGWGQSYEQVTERYLDTVRFRHNELIEPTRWHADILVNGVLDRHQGSAVLETYLKKELNLSL